MPRFHRYIAGGMFTCDPDNRGFKKLKSLYLNDHFTLYIQSQPANFDEPDNTQQSRPGPPIWGYMKFVNRDGMLSAMVYPLLVFYGVMGLV